MFKEVKTQLEAQWAKMVTSQLFTVNPDRDKIWEIYLSNFPEEKRQEHNCNSCKSFLRQYGGIVTIKDGKLESLWSMNLETVDSEYHESIKALRRFIESSPIEDVFLSTFQQLGTDFNVTLEGIRWTHFCVRLPKEKVFRGSRLQTVEAAQGAYRDSQAVLDRALREIPPEVTETVLDLISQDSLYRGAEFRSLLVKFKEVQEAYAKTPQELRGNFSWAISLEAPQIAKIRNTSIGTLLVDLAKGKDLEAAVASFEKMVAPVNYKRPQALVSTKQVEQVRKAVEDLGYRDSLERRFATRTELTAADALWLDKSSSVTDVFQEMAKDSIVNPRSFSKVEEVSIEKFISEILPTAKSLRVLLENSHFNNFVTLVTGPEPSMFKWKNPFSWSYTNGVTDSIKDKVKAAGGQVNGIVRVSLEWYNFDDLDLHVKEPEREKIYYGHKQGKSGGRLDVDKNAHTGTTRAPVENIIWEKSITPGTYKIEVNQFQKRENIDSGYKVEIECNGQLHHFCSDKSPGQDRTDSIVEFTWNGKDISLSKTGEEKLISKEKWDLKSNRYHKVTAVSLSPNYWESQIGNKHFMFFLEGCRADEQIRPFFNEYIQESLLASGKGVFELLGSKLPLAEAKYQMSGLGFSSTQRNHLFVEVTGSFTRIIKINF